MLTQLGGCINSKYAEVFQKVKVRIRGASIKDISNLILWVAKADLTISGTPELHMRID